MLHCVIHVLRFILPATFLFSKLVISGTVALCSLLTGSVISRFYNPELAKSVLGQNVTNALVQEANSTFDPVDPIEIELPNHVKIAIASSLCLLVGLVQVCHSSFSQQHFVFFITYNYLDSVWRQNLG
jgi:hypothetical protein